MKPRDNQRSKLYKAEAVLHVPPEFKTVEECQVFVDSVMATRWVRARWQKRFVVHPGRGHINATASYTGTLQMPLWSRQRIILLHEMAHILTPNQYASHGPEYAGVYLSLVQHILGAESATTLRTSFKAHGVKYNMRAVRCPRYTVVSQAQVAAAARQKRQVPPAPSELRQAAEVIRRAATVGLLGPSGRKPRAHALATARLLEVTS